MTSLVDATISGKRLIRVWEETIDDAIDDKCLAMTSNSAEDRTEWRERQMHLMIAGVLCESVCTHLRKAGGDFERLGDMLGAVVIDNQEPPDDASNLYALWSTIQREVDHGHEHPMSKEMIDGTL